MVAADKCSGCDLCGMYCPDFAIHGYRLPKEAGVAEDKQDTKKEAPDAR
jgi:2-oxoglutarate ferredoxin oxidoreductase subunit delta